MARSSPQSGQILLPALFIFPSLMLFVYLIFETAKLSREKIRHQFAIDAAAFVEMTNYSDFLNRTAYVNGAFPARIFAEGFDDGYWAECDQKTSGSCNKKLMRDLLYANGVFPALDSDPKKAATQSNTPPPWRIKYSQGTVPGLSVNPSCVNSSQPGDVTCKEDQDSNSKDKAFFILTQQNAHDYWINWDEAQTIYKMYVQIYQLLGSVEDAQWSVLKRLSASHNFFVKSYYLNTGESPSSAEEGKRNFHNATSGFDMIPQCHKKVFFYGNRPTNETFQGWQEWAPQDPPDFTGQGPKGCGLFQLATVPQGVLSQMKNGVNIIQHWDAPSNYFGVDFNRGISMLNNGRPWVHVRVSVGENQFAKVWPDPTPVFQVRTYP